MGCPSILLYCEDCVSWSGAELAWHSHAAWHLRVPTGFRRNLELWHHGRLTLDPGNFTSYLTIIRHDWFHHDLSWLYHVLLIVAIDALRIIYQLIHCR